VIGSTGFPQLPFQGTKSILIALQQFDFQFVKTLDGSAVRFFDRHRVQGDLGDGYPAMTHQKASSPDAQRQDRHQSSMSKVENQ
jgi:hypothetical protein